MMNARPIEDDWNILKRFLPKDWTDQAIQLGALRRKRKIDSAEILLRVLLIHLAEGKSLRTTAAYAQEAGLCDVNDVALLHRLRSSEEWLRWIAYKLFQDLRGPAVPAQVRKRFRIRLVDGTSISEPGSTGTDWRIHYCLRFETLRCDTFLVTDPRVVEDFQRYPVHSPMIW